MIIEFSEGGWSIFVHPQAHYVTTLVTCYCSCWQLKADFQLRVILPRNIFPSTSVSGFATAGREVQNCCRRGLRFISSMKFTKLWVHFLYNASYWSRYSHQYSVESFLYRDSFYLAIKNTSFISMCLLSLMICSKMLQTKTYSSGIFFLTWIIYLSVLTRKGQA